MTATATVAFADLRVLGQLGSGGQGVVYKVDGAAPGLAGPAAYKEYLPQVVRSVDWARLENLIRFGRDAEPALKAWLHENTAWPAAIVERDGAHTGFLMRLAPTECLVPLRMGAAYEPTLLALEFLLNPSDYLARVDLRLSEADRVAILQEMASLVAELHQNDIAIGDLSAKNIAVALPPARQCFLLDCDAVVVRGHTALDLVETQDWDVPAGEAPGTAHGDDYKFALCVIRVLAGDQATRDPAAIPGHLARLRQTAREVVDKPAADRPTARDWVSQLSASLPLASTAVPDFVDLADLTTPARPFILPGQRTVPSPAGGTAVTPAPPPRRRIGWAAAGIALAVVLVWVCLANLPSRTSTPVADQPGFTYVQQQPVPPAPTRPTAVGIVDIGAAAGDARAVLVGRVFDAYFSGINTKDLGRTFAVFDPSGVVNPNDADQRSGFAEGVATTQDTNVRLVGIGPPTGNGAALTARVTFVSHQAAGYGPARNPDETCTDWDITYSLTNGAGGYLILSSSVNSSGPC
jgi:hypothetical protein